MRLFSIKKNYFTKYGWILAIIKNIISKFPKPRRAYQSVEEEAEEQIPVVHASGSITFGYKYKNDIIFCFIFVSWDASSAVQREDLQSTEFVCAKKRQNV